VAMKFIDAALATDREAVARFQREAQAASLVESEHIVEIFDSGTTEDGRPYLVMELLRGEDLRQLVRRRERLPPDEATSLVADVLRGLARAHEAGIVHRDLKPDNVFLVDRDDRPCFAKIVDFGISKIQPESEMPTQTLTREGAVIGTPHYMSPEQALGRADIDHRTDLWAVGAILFECLTGRPPHVGKSYEEVIVAICSTDADDVRNLEPSVPDALADVVMGALCRDREGRFSSAREMLDALLAAAAGRPAPGSSRLARGMAPGPSRLERRWLSVVLAVLAGGALVSWLFYRFFVLQYFG
jgi:eukaryotic-like serine/threonine-protein kinase